MYGYHGQVVGVNLSKRSTTIKRIKEPFFKKYLGGVGLAAKIIFDNVGSDVDPLNAENLLVFAVGPFQGTGIPGSGKWIVASRSPLTNVWGESCAGGYWGPIFKNTGFDAVVIKGKADKPVYLWIHDGEAEIKDAVGIWGKTTSQTDIEIKKDIGEPRASVACIGPAGENLVRFASIISEHGFAGRTGMGAVMGSKNLKAVVVYGTRHVETAEPNKLRKYNKELSRKLYNATINGLRKHGTTASVPKYIDRMGYGLKENWRKGIEHFSPVLDGIDGDRFLSLTVSPLACMNCPIACHRHTQVREPRKYAYDGHGPEYETIAMFGWLNMVSDAKAVAYMGHLCNEYGMDTISTGSLLAFTAECYEKGWITKENLNGMKISWGDADSRIALIHKIAKRSGFGKILAEGIVKAAEYVGHEANEIIVHCKGLDYPGHDPRGFYPTLLNYATGPRGACHQRGFVQWNALGVLIPEWQITEEHERHSMKNAANLVIKYQDWATIFNSLIQCEYMIFGGLTLTHQTNFLKYVTGWNVTPSCIAEIAERIFNLQRMINVNYGVTKCDDTAPPRIFRPLDVGQSAGKIPQQFDEALMEYYQMRGWDSNGKPTLGKLKELGIK